MLVSYLQAAIKKSFDTKHHFQNETSAASSQTVLL